MQYGVTGFPFKSCRHKRCKIRYGALHPEDGKTEPLHTEDSGTNWKIDYVLVYEKCAEEENKDEKSKNNADELVRKRNDFERSLSEKAKLKLFYPKQEPMKRHTVSSGLFRY